jgi:cell division protein FtsB
MREFQEKGKYKRILYSKIVVIILAVLILFFAKATYGVYKKQLESKANALQAISELQKLQDREKLLNSELTRLSTHEGVEEEIRAKYGVSKPGEEMIIIVDNSKPTTTSTIEKKGFWNSIKNIFN